MILNNSRYSDPLTTTVVRVPDANGVYQVSVLRTIASSQTTSSLYLWQAGDRPDAVAQKFLQDPTLWWTIFDVNPELLDPLNIPVGSVVRIPANPVVGSGTVLQ